MFACEVHSQSRGPGPGLGLVTVILHYLSLNTQPGQLGNSCGYIYKGSNVCDITLLN